MSKKKVTKKVTKKNPVGCPTKYNKKACQKLIEFFDVPLKQIREKEVATNTGVRVVREEKPTPMPTFEGFCASFGIAKSTMHRWIEKHPEFSDAYRIAKQLQQNHLVQNGLDGSYNSAFAKFVAINCTDYVDRKEHKVDTGEKGFTLNYNLNHDN